MTEILYVGSLHCLLYGNSCVVFVDQYLVNMFSVFIQFLKVPWSISDIVVTLHLFVLRWLCAGSLSLILMRPVSKILWGISGMMVGQPPSVCHSSVALCWFFVLDPDKTCLNNPVGYQWHDGRPPSICLSFLGGSVLVLCP